MQLNHPLIVLDLETTGIWIEKDKIIEIAMIKCFPDKENATYLKKINPGMPIPPAVSKLTGIQDKDVMNEPPFSEVAQNIFDFIGDADFAGYNVERFDLPLLEREFKEAQLKFPWRRRVIYDAQKIYHLHEKRDLSAAYKFYCQKELVGAHSALNDAKATLEILTQQVRDYTHSDDITALQSFEYQTNNVFYDNERKFRWWNGKLYMMFGKYAKKYSLQEVVQRDPKYLEWMLSADFHPKIKNIVAKALKGEFPVENSST